MMVRLGIVAGLFVAAMATVQIWLAHSRYAIAHEATLARHHMEDTQAEINRLGLELASLSRPERLRELAKNQLGMAPPLPGQVWRP
jgi:cell division protein FtsL